MVQKMHRGRKWKRGSGVCGMPHETVPGRTFLTGLKLPLALVFLDIPVIQALQAFPRSRKKKKTHKS